VVERTGTDVPESEGDSDNYVDWLQNVALALGVMVGAWLIFAFGPTRAHSILGTKPTQSLVFFSVTLPFPAIYVIWGVIGAAWAVVMVVRRWSPCRSAAPEEVVVFVLAVVVAFVGVFASLYVQASHDSYGACFGRPITKLDAVYFTLGTLTTAGTGDLHVQGDKCIALATIQLGLGMVLLAIVIAGLVSRLMSNDWRPNQRLSRLARPVWLGPCFRVNPSMRQARKTAAPDEDRELRRDVVGDSVRTCMQLQTDDLTG